LESSSSGAKLLEKAEFFPHLEVTYFLLTYEAEEAEFKSHCLTLLVHPFLTI
jgi:hypothetical protein